MSLRVISIPNIDWKKSNWQNNEELENYYRSIGIYSTPLTKEERIKRHNEVVASPRKIEQIEPSLTLRVKVTKHRHCSWCNNPANYLFSDSELPTFHLSIFGGIIKSKFTWRKCGKCLTDLERQTIRGLYL